MTEVTIPVEALDNLTAGYSTAEWKPVLDVQVDTWRWGTVCRLVVENIESGKFYEVEYQTYHGEGDHDAYGSGGEPVVMRQVRRVEIRAFEYWPMDGAS